MMAKLALSIISFLLLGLLTYPATCPCRFQGTGPCNSIAFDLLVGGSPSCVSNTVPCKGCVCDYIDGQSECEIITSSVWKFNGTTAGQTKFCERTSTTAATCPQVAAANVSSCCTIRASGSVDQVPCFLRTFASYGSPGSLLRIHRVLKSNANITVSATAPADNNLAVTTDYELQSQFYYGITDPKVFANFTTGIIPGGLALIPKGTSKVLNYSFESLTFQQTLEPTDQIFQEIQAVSGPTYPYTTSLVFIVGGIGGDVSRVGDYLVRQCVYYEFDTTGHLG